MDFTAEHFVSLLKSKIRIVLLIVFLLPFVNFFVFVTDGYSLTYRSSESGLQRLIKAIEMMNDSTEKHFNQWWILIIYNM